MSVLVTVKVPGDVQAFRQAVTDRAAEFEAIAERARPAGCLHHQFGVGPDFVLVLDEWDTVDNFMTFFGDPELQAFIPSVGGDPSRAEVTIADGVESSDKF